MPHYIRAGRILRVRRGFWRSLESVEFFNLDVVIEWALLLNNSTTITKAGFYPEQHKQALMVEDRHLERLRPNRPRMPHYLTRGMRRTSRLIEA